MSDFGKMNDELDRIDHVAQARIASGSQPPPVSPAVAPPREQKDKE
jgi:hypothetical protein